MPPVSYFDYISAKFVMVYPCARPYILFYIHGSAVLPSYINITKLIKMVAEQPF